MDYGLSLELVNLHTQEPNRNRRESKYYWDELFTLIPAAGFTGIELPYEPKWDFGGRSGIPLSRRSVEIKYGSPVGFTKMLSDCGIKKLIGLHFDPSLFIGPELGRYFGAFRHFGEEAVRFAGEAGCHWITITPTPARGALEAVATKGAAWESWLPEFLKETAAVLGDLMKAARQCGVGLTVRNEYWSAVRGESIHAFMEQLDGDIAYDVDTAHLAIAGVDPEQFIGVVKGRLGSVHLTDTAFVDDMDCYRSATPEYPAGRATQVFRDIGQGTVALSGACRALEAAGYQGWAVCNNRQTRDVARAMLRTRRYINTAILQNGGLMRDE